MNQTTIFDVLYPKYKIIKPIRLIELFSGYGSQYLALKYLGANVKHYKICEWATKSIQAYNDLHIQDYFDYSGVLSDDNILKVLIELGVSINYNEPATKEQLKRLDFRKIYNNIIATNNLVNIQNVKGEDFRIVDKDQYDYIMTYSFPCQDLSLAGKGKGMADTSTRSGMLWEVERILNELKETNSLPQILLMENVPQVHGSDNVEHFNKWQLALENMGYKNYFQDLIATDYGIPQTRNRCFMVSILGEYSYTFPKPITLELKLKDMLEDEVDEKYYLSDKMLNYCFGVNQKESKFPRKERFLQSLEQTNDKSIATTITTNAGNRPTDNFIQEPLKKELCNKLIKEGDIIKHSYTNQILNGNKKCVEQTNGNMITLTTRGDCYGVCVGTYQYAKSDTLQTTSKEAVCYNDLRIRKLTPLECFRLMGVKDEDYYKIAKNQSNSSLYHLAGDSIVVNVLMAIFKELIK
jgi:DNA (cytosine-5)-methyltransferase 1